MYYTVHKIKGKSTNNRSRCYHNNGNDKQDCVDDLKAGKVTLASSYLLKVCIKQDF